MPRFTDLAVSAYAGAVVIVDVDGTIVHDGAPRIDARATEQLAALARVSDVYLCSNNTDTARTKAIAASVPGVRFLDTVHKKPSKHILNALPAIADRRLVVVGDKYLTDGRLARNIGAQFVPVSRMRHENDSRTVVATYLADDIYAYLSAAFLMVLSVLKLMRVKQWIKNVLVFAPLFFAQEALNSRNVVLATEAFALFCLTASAIYVMNDLFDLETDRAHPTKRLRPLASGAIPLGTAYAVLAVLVALVAFGSIMLPSVAPIIGIYVVLNVLYSLALKHIAVLDIMCVAAFYILRILAGGSATSTHISPWILLCVFFGALFLVIGKRRAEFSHASRRAVIDSYSLPALDYLLAGSAFLAIISYAIYSAIGSRSPLAVYSTVFVVIAIFRLLNRMFTAADHEAEFPESLLFKDRWALASFVAWALYMLAILYFV